MPAARQNLMGSRIVQRIDALAAISESPAALTRICFSPEHRRAADLILRWMEEAGLTARMDEIGNVIGRYEGDAPGLPCLMIGSHFDTVRDAGKWDGPLGVLTSIECVAEVARRGLRLPFALEVVAFADEEGVRFSSTLLGSRAVAGTFDYGALEAVDADGLTMREAMEAFGLKPGAIRKAARKRGEILAYTELHIEQGPALEVENVPVGVVTAISGRLAISPPRRVRHPPLGGCPPPRWLDRCQSDDARIRNISPPSSAQARGKAGGRGPRPTMRTIWQLVTPGRASI